MNVLVDIFKRRLNNVSLDFVRGMMYEINCKLFFTGSSLLEIGGKNKEISPEISGDKFATYFALDDIEYGHRNQIPL